MPSSISAHLLAPHRKRITLQPAGDGWMELPRPVDPEAVLGLVAASAVAVGLAGVGLQQVSEPLGGAVLLVALGLLLLAVLGVVLLYVVAAVGLVLGIGSLATRRGRARASAEVRRGAAALGAAFRLPAGTPTLEQLAAVHPHGVPVARAAVVRVAVEPGGVIRRRATVTFHDGSTRQYRSWHRTRLPELLQAG